MVYWVSCNNLSNNKSFSKLRNARRYMRKMEKDCPVIIRINDGKCLKYSYSFSKQYR